MDSIWYSTCFAGLTFSHHTKRGDFFGKDVSLELVESGGRDNLQIQVDFCHQNGLEAFWSLRMNDTHDAFPEGIRTNFHPPAPFKREHPEYMMGEPGDWEKYPQGPKHGWTSLDFSYPEVCIPWLFWHYWAFLELAADEHPTLDDWIATMYCGDPKDLDKPSYLKLFNAWEGTAANLRGAAANLWNPAPTGSMSSTDFAVPA